MQCRLKKASHFRFCCNNVTASAHFPDATSKVLRQLFACQLRPQQFPRIPAHYLPPSLPHTTLLPMRLCSSCSETRTLNSTLVRSPYGSREPKVVHRVGGDRGDGRLDGKKQGSSGGGVLNHDQECAATVTCIMRHARPPHRVQTRRSHASAPCVVRPSKTIKKCM